MEKKNIIITAVIALLVSFGVAFVLPSKTVTVVKEVDTVGAMSSPDSPSPYFSFGGVRRWAEKKTTLTAATSTVCAIKSPVATSTLVKPAFRLTTSSTSASVIRISKAATAFATTTTLASANVAANAQATIFATSTNDNFVIGNSQYIVFSIEGGTGVFSPTGSCQATFEEI